MPLVAMTEVKSDEVEMVEPPPPPRVIVFASEPKDLSSIRGLHRRPSTPTLDQKRKQLNTSGKGTQRANRPQYDQFQHRFPTAIPLNERFASYYSDETGGVPISSHLQKSIELHHHEERMRGCRYLVAVPVLAFVVLLLLHWEGFFDKSRAPPAIAVLGDYMRQLPLPLSILFRAQTRDGQLFAGRVFVTEDRLVQSLCVTTVMNGQLLAEITDNGTSTMQTFYGRLNDEEVASESAKRLPLGWLFQPASMYVKVWPLLANRVVLGTAASLFGQRAQLLANVTRSPWYADKKACEPDQLLVTQDVDSQEMMHVCLGLYGEPRWSTSRHVVFSFHQHHSLADDGNEYSRFFRVHHLDWSWPELVYCTPNAPAFCNLWHQQTRSVQHQLPPIAWGAPGALSALVSNLTQVPPAREEERLVYDLKTAFRVQPLQSIGLLGAPPLYGATCLFVASNQTNYRRLVHFTYQQFTSQAQPLPLEWTYWGMDLFESFQSDQGYSIGCVDNWLLFTNSVAEICNQANPLLRRATAVQPLVVFAHGLGGVWLLQGIQLGACSSQLTWFSVSVPLGPSGDNNNILHWLSSDSSDVWPVADIQSYLSLAGLPAPLVALQALVPMHILGAMCGRSALGRQRAVDVAIVAAMDQLNYVRSLVYNQSAPPPTDGAYETASCQHGLQGNWLVEPTHAFYVADLNYWDTTCAHGDHPTLESQQPCLWYRARIRSVYNETAIRIWNKQHPHV